jgi:Tfp pilus assembly PilM family ATPase
MTRLLALDLDPRELRLLLANRQGSAIVVEEVRTQPIKEVEGVDPIDAMGEALKILLADGRHRGAEVLVTLPRNEVELRLLNMPLLPAEELPEAVRLQAVREFSEMDEDWPLDYLTTYETSEQMTVLAAGMKPKRLAAYRRILEQSDLKPRSMVLRATAAALLARQEAQESGATAKVELAIEDLGETMEITVLRAGVPVLIRTIASPHLPAEQRVDYIGQEVRRTLLSARNQLQGETVQGVVLFAAKEGPFDAHPVAMGLQSRVNLPVRLVDPFEQLTWDAKRNAEATLPPGRFAAAVGLLAAQTLPAAPTLDLLNPRRAEPPRSYRREILAGAAACLTLALLGGGLLYWKFSEIDGQIAAVEQQIQRDKKAAEAAVQRIAEVEVVRTWEQMEVNWLQLMQDVSQRIPDAEKARFSKWQARLTPEGMGQVTIEGIVDQQSTIGALNQSLVQERRRVSGENSDYEGREEGFPWRFKQVVTIETDAAKKLAAASGSRRRGARTAPAAAANTASSNASRPSTP